ncbi:MAG TPA: hypothetical protein DCL44_02980 [Elusimicrobia bacterium]|nr:hypothetical protein [Elusimicrobiota bacterium]
MGKFRYVLLASIPFVILCFFLIHNASDFPVGDQWDLVPLLEKWHLGSLTLRDLWVQHNEHRIFFPELIMVSVAAVTHWNLYCEVIINLLLGTGICALLFLQIRKTEIFFNTRANAVYFLASVFAFSVAQSDNWLLGYQMGIPLNILSFTAGVFLLTSPELGLKRLLCAMAAGIITTYSFANGMLFWIIGFLILCARPIGNKKTALASWTLISVLIVASYLWGYQKAPQHPPLLFALQHPLRAAGYFFVFLGSPLLPFERFAPLIGFFGLICFAASIYAAYHVYMLTRKNQAALLMVIPWFALASYGIASAGVSMIGRAGLGIGQATASRYVTISNLLWLSLIVLAPVAAQSLMRRPGWLSKIVRNRALQYACLIVFFSLQVCMVKQKWFWENVRKNEWIGIRNALLAGDYNEELINARVYHGDLRERIAVLKKYQLAFFRGKEFTEGSLDGGNHK